jgi:imidazolonepropionase-like amidohydrolase
VNPESRHIGTTRSNGVLVAVSAPSGGLVSGQSAAMMLDGWTYEQMTLRSQVALIVNWPNPANQNQYEGSIRELRGYFEEARAYRTRVQGAQEAVPVDARLAAMIPVLEGDVPVMVNANELRQLQDAMTWAEEEGVRLILLGGADAGYVAEHLAQKQIPVLLTSVIGAPGRSWEAYDASYSLPARLHEAGVVFGITGGSSAPYANRLPYEAGSAIAYGLPEDEAVRSVTLNPARILGIDDRVGSLEVGKDATLLITTGNPLEYLARIEQAYVQGRAIDMMDAHLEFYEKYAEKGRQMQSVEW